MRGAAPLALHEGRGIRQDALGFGGDVVLPGTDDDGGRGDAGFGDRVEHVGKQRSSGDRVQHLGPRRTHARALAGRQHDRQASPVSRPGFHRQPPRRSLSRGDPAAESREFRCGKPRQIRPQRSPGTRGTERIC